MSCTEAQKKAYREYYKRHKEQEKQRYYSYYAKNRDEIIKKRRKKYAENFEYSDNLRKQAREYKREKRGAENEK